MLHMRRAIFSPKKLAATAIFIVSLPAVAVTTSSYDVGDLKAHPEGIYFYLEGFINTDALVNCSSNEFFIPVSGGNFGGRTSFLLAAKTSGKRVQVTYYECSGSRIMAASVVVN
jgi:hypothetical protein